MAKKKRSTRRRSGYGGNKVLWQAAEADRPAGKFPAAPAAITHPVGGGAKTRETPRQVDRPLTRIAVAELVASRVGLRWLSGVVQKRGSAQRPRTSRFPSATSDPARKNGRVSSKIYYGVPLRFPHSRACRNFVPGTDELAKISASAKGVLLHTMVQASQAAQGHGFASPLSSRRPARTEKYRICRSSMTSPR